LPQDEAALARRMVAYGVRSHYIGEAGLPGA
jgi:hypothetical protein